MEKEMISVYVLMATSIGQKRFFFESTCTTTAAAAATTAATATK